MRAADLLLLDFDTEMEKTRTYFGVLPEEKADWRPHERSPTLGRLAKHIALLPRFGALFLTSDSMDATAGPPPLPEFVSCADLKRTLDENSAQLRGLLQTASDEYLMKDWAFMAGGKVLQAAPRAAMYRVMFLHHLIHHRGQLGVYLRLLEVPLPGLYGPSADRPWQMDGADAK
jgi:uncharacterized damage-inducible protein DinB